MGKGVKKQGKVYFGWWIVAVAFLVMALSFAPSQSLPGLFVKPIAEEFGVSRTVATLVQTATTIALMLTSLVAGCILSRVNIRRMVVIALLLQATCNFLISVSPSLSLLFVTGVGRGIAISLGTLLPASILVNNWFGSKIRGRAWGIAVVGSGVGALVLTPIVGAIMDHFSWRGAFAFFAILSLSLIPLVLLVYVRHPQDKGLTQLGRPEDSGIAAEKPDTSGIPAQNALGSGVFWLLMLAVFLLAGSVQTWNMNGAAYLSDLGNDVIQVSFLVSVSSIGLTVGKIVLGAISDKFSSRVSMAFGSILLITGYILTLVGGKNPLIAYPAMVILGVGLGVPTVMGPLLTRDLFGSRDFGTLSGITQAGISFGASILAVLASLVYEWTGGYLASWVGACVFSVLTVCMVALAYRLQPALAKKYWQKQ